MQSEFAASEIPVEQLNMLLEFLRIPGSCQFSRQFFYPVPDPAARKASVISSELVAADHLIVRHTPRIFDICEPVGEQFPEDLKIVRRDTVQSPRNAAPDLTGPGICIFMIDQNIGEERMPHIAGETVTLRLFDHLLHQRTVAVRKPGSRSFFQFSVRGQGSDIVLERAERIQQALSFVPVQDELSDSQHILSLSFWISNFPGSSY